MEAVLPYNTKDREQFYKCVCQLGFQEFMARKFIYIMQDSDMDVYHLMAEERLSMLIYGWEICHAYMQEQNITSLTDNVKMVMKRLIYYSLEVWFSKEWELCKPARKVGLFFCLKRAKDFLNEIENFSMLNLDYLLGFEMKPWRVQYLNTLFSNDMSNQRHDESNLASIENVENLEVNEDDIAFVNTEGLLVILFRLIKLFDSGSIEAVKFMSIRMVATCNYIYAATKTPFNDLQKRCLILICHMYLLTFYELDDVRGFYIDNMMNNIRFYCASMQNIDEPNTTDNKDMKLTAAQQIATACTNLNITSNEFFEAYIFDKFDECFTTIFGVVSHSYLSYVLGNMLNEMNNMNEEDLAKNLDKFKCILNYYIIEREGSEKFTLTELEKLNRKRHSHTMSLSMQNMYEFKRKFCKGNRMSNIGNYENADEAEEDTTELNISNLEHARQIDPVFQNIPNNANILNYVYDILAKRSYKGWHFAKLVLLLKIIGHDLNQIETWRYHPGLTTDFMLNLETNLAKHYEDLAKIFEEHQFIEQEFWLTAFYLHPNIKYYGIVNRCGMRWNRRRNAPDTTEDNVKPAEKVEKYSAPSKFGLLSSTFDVHEIIQQTNLEAPDNDYVALEQMLRSLHLPQNVVKDLLTVCFQRNKGFAWAVNWLELRKRCKTLYKIGAKKRRLVELNMAEANDRLKFLKIDYDKYKNRPQLDYGAIEEGYEGTKYADIEAESIDDDEEDDDDDEYGNEMEDYNKKTKEKEEIIEEELLDECFIGTRRTRARTAAVIASAIQKRKEESKKAEEQEKGDEPEKQTEQENVLVEVKVEDIKKEQSEAENESEINADCNVNKKDLNTWLDEHTSYKNSTEGFKAFPNIWDFDKETAQDIDDNSTLFFENKTKHIYDLFKNLRNTEQTAETQTPTTSPTKGGHESSIDVARASSALPPQEDIIQIPYRALSETIVNEDNNKKSFYEAMKNVDQKCCPTEPVIAEEEHQEQESDMPIESEECSYTQKLIRECLMNEVKVLIPRLTIADVTQLRQPKVFVERIDWQSSVLGMKRRRSKKVYTDYEMSSKSSDTFSSELSSHSRKRKQSRKRTPKPKRRMYLAHKPYCSESSTESDEYKSNKHKPLDATSEQEQNTAAQTSTARIPNTAAQSRVHIPSSLSDNSLDATNRTKLPSKCIEVFDFIHISSSSSHDTASPVYIDSAVSDQSNIHDPLYEEEIII